MRSVNIYILACLFSLMFLAAGISCAQNENAGNESPAIVERENAGTGVVGEDEEPSEAGVEGDEGGEISEQESVNWDEGTSSFEMDDSTLEGIVLGDGAGEGADLEIPEEWPEEIPVPEGYGLRDYSVYPNGSFVAAFRGEGSLEDISALYYEAFADWELRESGSITDISRDMEMMCWYQGEDTVDIHVVKMLDSGRVIVNIMYNIRTAPGYFPEGWPDYIPIMPGLEVESGYVDSDRELSISLEGTLSLEEIGAWYEDNLVDWTLDLPEGMEPLPQDSLIMYYTRDSEEVSIYGYFPTEDGPVMVLITWKSTE